MLIAFAKLKKINLLVLIYKEHLISKRAFGSTAIYSAVSLL